MEDRMDEGLPLSLPIWGSSQVTLCESVSLCVSGKRNLDGCGFRSGCPVVTAHSCDTVNHAAITHAHRHLHGHSTHTDMRMQIQDFACACAFLLSHTHFLKKNKIMWLWRSFFFFWSEVYFFIVVAADYNSSFFSPCCHILNDSTVIMIVLLVMTKVITWWPLKDSTEWINM